LDDDTLFTIGQMAERTGLPVRTIRFYSDSGLVPPSTRSGSGYRLYDTARRSTGLTPILISSR
jgi:DNA-binding transcriptional MerR regulator